MLKDLDETQYNDEYQKAQCKICKQCFTSQRYMLTHLSTDHFQDKLDHDLPNNEPWKCPKCDYNWK